jgi:hypothetical protein
MKPETVVNHIAGETLFGTARVVAGAAHAATIFTTQIAGEGIRHLVEGLQRLVVVFDLDAVVGVDAAAVW